MTNIEPIDWSCKRRQLEYFKDGNNKTVADFRPIFIKKKTATIAYDVGIGKTNKKK
jgi:hypothetical protein